MHTKHLAFYSLVVLLLLSASLAVAWVFNTHLHNSSTHVPTPQPYVTGAPEILPGDPVFGPDEATVTVTAFMDFGCESCVAGFERILQVYNRLPEGTMKLVWKDLPEHGTVVTKYRTAHEAARCSAPHGVFWSYAGTLFAQGPNLLLSENFTELATSLGVPKTAFEACLDAKSVSTAIDRTTQQARARGIASTPFFYINDVAVDGVRSVNELQNIILEEAQL